MKVNVRRIDPYLPLPAYATPGAVAADCSAREDVTVAPGSFAYIPLNIAMKPPQGHFILMAPRSSLHKRGLLMANSVGIFDEDFCGDEDEYKAAVYNITQQPVEVKKGERITQILMLPYDKIEWNEVETLDQPRRGGFGSTGV